MRKTARTFLPALPIIFTALLLAGCQTNLFNEAVNFWSLGCCGGAAIILDIVALIELAGSTKPTRQRVLWALLIIFAPYLGCILYYFFGR